MCFGIFLVLIIALVDYYDKKQLKSYILPKRYELNFLELIVLVKQIDNLRKNGNSYTKYKEYIFYIKWSSI